MHYTILIEIYISHPFNTAESLREISTIHSAAEKGGGGAISMLFLCSSTVQSMFHFKKCFQPASFAVLSCSESLCASVLLDTCKK